MLGKKIKKLGLFRTIVLAGLALTFILPLSSCVKNQDCTAVLTIIDSCCGKPHAAYTIALKYNINTTGKTNTVATLNTDGTGTATFTFKNPAIYDVDVTQTFAPGAGTAFTVGIIKLQQGSSVAQTYVFK